MLVSMNHGTGIAPRTYEKWKKLKSEEPDCTRVVFVPNELFEGYSRQHQTLKKYI